MLPSRIPIVFTVIEIQPNPKHPIEKNSIYAGSSSFCLLNAVLDHAIRSFARVSHRSAFHLLEHKISLDLRFCGTMPC
jgi:hypothetical protein